MVSGKSLFYFGLFAHDFERRKAQGLALVVQGSRWDLIHGLRIGSKVFQLLFGILMFLG